MQFHKYATFFPLMEGDEFEALVADIKAHGLLEPIVTLDDQILDGRNRYRACQKSGTEPKFQAYQGNGALSYVISKNIRRRHLKPAQLGVISLETEKELAAEEAERQKQILATPGAGKRDVRGVRHADRVGMTRTRVGKLFGIGEHTVRVAKYASRSVRWEVVE